MLRFPSPFPLVILILAFAVFFSPPFISSLLVWPSLAIVPSPFSTTYSSPSYRTQFYLTFILILTVQFMRKSREKIRTSALNSRRYVLNEYFGKALILKPMKILPTLLISIFSSIVYLFRWMSVSVARRPYFPVPPIDLAALPISRKQFVLPSSPEFANHDTMTHVVHTMKHDIRACCTWL